MKIKRIVISLILAIAFACVNVSTILAAIPTNVTSPANGSYNAGKPISIQVVFDQSVTVSGIPQLALNSGGTAYYSSGSPSTTLTFTYIVGSTDNSSDLDYIASNSLTLNGGTIKDNGGVDADLTLPEPGTSGSLGWNKNIIIDTIAPTVTNVNSSSPNSSYRAGQAISIQVSFSEVVNVTSGTPTLALNSGGTASYTSGGPSSTLTFTYTVAAGNTSADLDYSATNSLAGTIKDGAGNSANLTLPAPGAAHSLGVNNSIIIDTTAPTISIGAPSVTSTNIGPVTYTITYSDTNFNASTLGTGDITLNKTGTANGTIGVDAGSGLIRTVTISSLTGTGTLGISILPGTANDTAGNTAPSSGASTTFVVDNTAPTVTFNLQTSSDSGTSNSDNITNVTSPIIDASFSEAVIGFASSDLSNIGTAPGCIFSTGAPSGFSYPVTVSSCGSGTLIIQLAASSVTDNVGNTNAVADGLIVTIDRIAPVISAVTPLTNAFISSITTASAVSYTLSEVIASGSITMNRTGGTNDPDSPHTCTIIGTALISGAHTNLDLSNTSNACTVAQSLVNGTIYSFTFNATDLAGNTAAPIIRTNVTFDSSAPAFSAVTPVTNSFINNITTASDVGYTLSKAIVSGSITMSRTGGANDPGSPHVCSLAGTAMNAGAHSNLNLSDTVNGCKSVQTLVSGTIYTFTFNGTDTAGNPAATVTNTNVTFDNTPPVFSVLSPLINNAYINNITTSSDVSYTLSESLASGSITMTWTGGTNDPSSPDVCNLTGAALGVGLHYNLNLADIGNGCTSAQSLMSGAIYNFTFTGIDSAGNAAATVLVTHVIFDNTPPTISIGVPSASITKHGPVTFTVTYFDTYFSGSNLNYSNVSLVKPNPPNNADGSIGVTGSGLSYTVTISSITGNGSLGIFIAAATAWDLAGNYSPASIPSTTFLVDNTLPSANWIAPVNDQERYYTSNEQLTLLVNAFDNVAISKVVFKRYDYIALTWVEIGTVINSPYSLIIDTSLLLPGNNQVNAEVADTANNWTVKYIWLYHYPVLTVVKNGTGNGTVTSSPSGVNCGTTCSYGFPYFPPPNSTVVTLTATSTFPSLFTGWNGESCSGTGTCTVTMNASKSVTATFTMLQNLYIPLIFR